ncbi:MAG: DUF4412 domain-containing protein [Candidatus Latescibacterota bacterium]
MNRVSKVLVCLVVVIIASVSAADAGWVILEADGQEVLIAKGKMKSAWDNGVMIIDAEKNEICFIDDNRKMLASGNVDEICGEMTQMVESMMANVPDEQKEMMKKMMGDTKAPKVEIVKKGAGEKVAGFETMRYDVMSDGALYEELWLSADKALMKDCEAVMKMMVKFMSCMQAVSSMGSKPSPEASPEYVKLFELGMMVKSVSHAEGGTAENTDITTISKKDLSDADFALPDGYKRVSFQAMWGMGEE